MARGALGRILRVGTAVRVHEQQVDVARVVQLGAAELAQADHGQPVLTGRQPAGLGEARLRDRRDLGDDVLERRPAEVARGDAEHRATPEAAGARPRGRRVRRRLGARRRAAGAVRASTSASADVSSGWRTNRSAAAVENPRSRAATGSTSGRSSCSRAAGSAPTRESAIRASSGSGASRNARSRVSEPDAATTRTVAAPAVLRLSRARRRPRPRPAIADRGARPPPPSCSPAARRRRPHRGRGRPPPNRRGRSGTCASARRAPVRRRPRASAAITISQQRAAWPYASTGGSPPSGMTGAVPETNTRSPTTSARENPMTGS